MGNFDGINGMTEFFEGENQIDQIMKFFWVGRRGGFFDRKT
jgi:hypothetical protein